MRLLITISILTFSSFCFGQDIEFVETDAESFYKVMTDSINLEFDYPDGRYKLFETDTSSTPRHVFHLENGNVDGPYLGIKSCSWVRGNYFQDSLWTFLTNPKDTTFKIGTWRRYLCGLDMYPEELHKMPFDSSGLFKETWEFTNGKIVREAIFEKGFGLQKETYWDFETNKITRQTIKSRTKNYYQSITYQNDSISYVSLTQNGIRVAIDFDYSSFLDENESYTKVEIYSDNGEINGLPINSINLDSSNALTDFQDLKRQIFISEDENGNLEMRYLNKKGKWKYKKLKVK